MYNSYDPENLISKKVIYYDYLDSERYGKIVAIEPYAANNDIVYVYIEDDEPDENIYEDLVNGRELVKYAELRLSSEVIIDE